MCCMGGTCGHVAHVWRARGFRVKTAGKKKQAQGLLKRVVSRLGNRDGVQPKPIQAPGAAAGAA